MSILDSAHLRLLLLATAPIIARAKVRSARLKEMLADSPFIFQIQTGDGVSGYFELRDRRLRARLGVHPQPTFTQNWKKSADAVSVMLSKDETEILRAMEDGRCTPSGSFLVGMWFNEAMKIARGA